jgi:hypothetical protein
MIVIRHTGNCGLLYFLADTYSTGTVISISFSADCSPSIPRLNTDPLRPDRGALKVTVPPGLYGPQYFVVPLLTPPVVGSE